MPVGAQEVGSPKAKDHPRPTSPGRFGTIEGVFVPTTLTILGVILFVRTSWVVGQVGLLGAWSIMAGAYLISAMTALSVSSIVSNVRVEAGGAFALLTRTLGIEPGGSIGLPLYFSQTLAITMYLFGFREGWLWVFPDHPAWAIDLVSFLAVFGLASASARLAFRLQYGILAVIAVSLVSIGASLGTAEQLRTPTWWSPGGEVGLAAAFAVFFPAVTGIMAGVNMSGDLARPKHSIVRGSLWAIGVTFVIYVLAAGVVAVVVAPDVLAQSETALIDAGAWSPAVLAGLLAATFSSALSTAVGAPRILQALAQHGIVPADRWLSRRWRQEPLPASLVTASIVGLALLARDLNAIAPLITMFFLLTYGAINATLLLQQGLDLPRFRPSFRVPLLVPALGTAGCAAAMWVVSPWATAIAVVAVAALYMWLAHQQLGGPFGQVRAGIVLAASSWVRGRMAQVPSDYAWQAHMVVPLVDPERDRGLLPVLAELAHGGGSVMLLASSRPSGRRVEELADVLQEAGTATRHATVHHEDALTAVERSLTLLAATLAPPNLLVVPMALDTEPLVAEDALDRLLTQSRAAHVGLWLVDLPQPSDEDARRIDASRMTLWIEGRSTVDRRGTGLELLLVGAWRFARAWGLDVCVVVCVAEEGEQGAAVDAAVVAAERAHLPNAETRCYVGDLEGGLESAPAETLHLAVLQGDIDTSRVGRLRSLAGGRLVIGCLSGQARAD